jgi:putative ABC transport system permease protein
MINSYKEITGKYLKTNKKRTVLTIIGIILSVALVSSIGFFFKSMQAAQIEEIRNNYGSMHVMYNKVDENLITKIKSNPNVLASGIYGVGEEKPLNDKLIVKEVFGSDKALKLMPYKLKEGRFPEKNTEVAMESWFIGKVKNGAKIGDTVKVLDKEYTLVGVLNDRYSNQYEGIGELLTRDDNIEPKDKVLVLQLKPNKRMREQAEGLRALADEADVTINDYLIDMEGQGIPEGMIPILVVIISIVIVSTIAVIYNAFQISVVERVKQFGLLRAVGATPKQIRRIILREATFLAGIGIPIGLIFGIIALYGIYFTFKLIGGEGLTFISPTISLDVLIISLCVGLLSIYASAFIPAVFAGRISPLVAISSRNSITKEKIKRKKSLFIGKIFGFEGAMASKNIKRNRKRYRTTVFSIVISVTLFITFKAFMDMSLNVYSTLNESNKIHFSVVQSGNSQEDTRKVNSNIIESINKMTQVDTAYKVYDPYVFYSAIDKGKEFAEVKNLGEIYRDIKYNGEDKTLIDGSLVIYDENSFEAAKSYLKEGKIDVNELNAENGVVIIGKNIVYNPHTDNRFYGPIADVKVGDEILLQYNELQYGDSPETVEFGEEPVKKVKVMAILEDDPFNFRGSQSDLKILSTEAVAEKLIGKEIDPTALNIKLKDEKLENEAKAGIESIISSSGDLRLINIIDQNRTEKSGILMVKILLYGFVVVVSLIGSVNIINTLTTNIILRRREFAALKSIGLTQRGLRKMITLEGMLYGVMGSIYGSIIGSLLSYLIYSGMNDVREQRYMLPFQAISIAVAGAMLIGYISVLAPLKRMKNDNLIEAVREDF